MRDATRRAITDAVAQAIQPVADAEEAVGLLAEALAVLAKKVERIQPAQVDLSQELADDITRKLRGPLTIPQEMSDWIRQEAQYHDMLSISRLGYSATAGDLRWTLRSDGTMELEIRDMLGSRWWIGVFGPPDKS